MQLSIITINLNNKPGLEKTIGSVLKQAYKDYEHIIIDGGSIDGSVDVIRQNADKIDYWISESDTGVYEAMNKGIRKATGEYLLFLNSGDYLFDEQVLQKVFYNKCTEDVVYGNAFIYNLHDDTQPPRYVEFPHLLTLYLFYSWTICHNASFIKRSFQINNLYDENLTIASDFKFFLKAFLNGANFKHIGYTITCVDCNGISAKPDNVGGIERACLLKSLIPKKKLMKLQIMDGFYRSASLLNRIGSRSRKANLLIARIGSKLLNKKKSSRVTSYSQCGEDLIVEFIFKNYLKIDNPSYIDIGAHHPFNLNNTALFYERGCRGVNIEPNSELFAAFKRYRKRDVNLNIGIADRNGELDFYIMSSSTMSTFSREEAQLLEENTSIKIKEVKKIGVQTLDVVLKKYCRGGFPDFLSLDVEGLEESILKNIDFNNNYPKIICLETLSYSEQNDEKKDERLIEFLIEKGYFVYADTYINTIFVKLHEWNKR